MTILHRRRSLSQTDRSIHQGSAKHHRRRTERDTDPNMHLQKCMRGAPGDEKSLGFWLSTTAGMKETTANQNANVHGTSASADQLIRVRQAAGGAHHGSRRELRFEATGATRLSASMCQRVILTCRLKSTCAQEHVRDKLTAKVPFRTCGCAPHDLESTSTAAPKSCL